MLLSVAGSACKLLAHVTWRDPLRSIAWKLLSDNPISRLAGQLLDFLRQSRRLLLQFRAFLLQLFGPLRRQFVQHAQLPLADLAELVIGTFPQATQRFDDRDDFELQRFVEPAQLGQFRLFTEIETRPTLAQDQSRESS